MPFVCLQNKSAFDGVNQNKKRERRAMEPYKDLNKSYIEGNVIHPVNDDANAVFGGEKQSGVGRFNGDFVKEKITTAKWVTVQHEDREYTL